MFTQQDKTDSSRILLLIGVTVACAGLAGCQTGPHSKLENDVYNCFNKFSGKIPKGFVREPKEQNGSSDIHVYHDPAFNPFSVKERGYLDSLPPRIKTRFLWYKRNVAASSELIVGRINFSREDWERLDDASEAEKLAFFKRNPSSILGFGALWPLQECDRPESYILQKGSDGVCYERYKRGASWIRYEVHDNASGFFSRWNKEQLQEDKIVPPEQVQRYIDLAERFYKTYSLPKGEPD